MKNMDNERLKKELAQIDEERIRLEGDLKTCRDEVLEKKILRELRTRAARTKAILFKLGRYKFPEDEMIEYEPGKFMPANEYWWLMDV